MADDYNPSFPAPVSPETSGKTLQTTTGLNGTGNGQVAPVVRPTAAHPATQTARKGFWRSLWHSSPPPANSQAHQADSVREVIETVVFVVVLVLLLKSFAAEAFVIPTGSMAQTLYGYQKIVTCPDCGIEFPVNCSSEVDPTDGGRLDPVFACTCPNCRQHIHFPYAPEWYRLKVPDSKEIPDPGWSSGDRVLVGKFVYDVLSVPPNRLDVVVFKYPGDHHFPHTGPFKNNVPMNYIKRLIGLPGETIVVHGGNIYILDASKSAKYHEYEASLHDPELFARLWQKDFMHIDEAKDLFAQELSAKRQFHILRKDPETLLAMMRLVFDNDHPGRGHPERWHAADGWEADGRGFKHGGAGAAPHWLRYWHLPNRYQPSRRELITDFMGYNTFVNSVNHGGPPGENWANDLILECDVTVPDNPSGEFTLELSKGVDRFRARWELGSPNGLCSLYRLSDGKEQKLGEGRPTALNRKGTYKLRFANVDERLTVWVDGKLPFDAGIPYDPPKVEGPDAANDFEPASIGIGQGSGVRVSKLRLFRDTYYTANHDSPSQADAPDADFGDPSTWGSLRRPRTLSMYVQPGHYLCMGDNSPESSDGRSWGTVPQRLLLGRAVVVYWPISRAGRIR
jgi:signal peptidase I